MRRRNLDSSLTVGKIAWHVNPKRSLRNRPMPSAYFLFLLLLLLFCFLHFGDFYTFIFFTANACCYFGNRDVDQTEQGSGRCNKHFPFALFLSFLLVIATKFVCTLCSSSRISLRINLFQCSIKHGFPQAQVYAPY